MKYFFAYLWLFFSIHEVAAQHKVDSLRNLLVEVEDSLRIEVLNELSKSLNHTDPKNSLKYAIEAKQLSLELNNLALIGKSVNYIGVSYYYLNELDLSNESYFEALHIFDSINHKHGLAKALNNIAWNYKTQGLIKEAIEYFNQGLDLAVEIDNVELQQGLLNNLGTAYRQIGELRKAFDIYQQSLEINRRIDNKQWEAYNLSNIGLIYLDTLDTDKALYYFNEARKINEEHSYIQELAKNYLNIGGTYVMKNEFVLAEEYLQIADSIIEENGYKREKLQYYGYKIQLGEESKNFAYALEYYEKYHDLMLQLNKLAWNEKVSELQAKYDIAQKNRGLEKSQIMINQQRIVIFGGSLSFLLLVVVLLLLLKMYKSKNRWVTNIENLNDEIKEKNQELQSMNEEIQGINNRLESLVEERTKKIKDQNEKLVKYAFFNSHELRGPLARVLGLVYLLKLENKAVQNDDSFSRLQQATEELDNAISDASKLLEDEKLLIKGEKSS